MNGFCPCCREQFIVGDRIQALPAILQLRIGGKSGQLGWYPDLNVTTDYVHVECVQSFYEVENSPAWDQIEGNLRDRVRDEEAELIREEVRQEFADANGLICKDCMEVIEHEDVGEIQVNNRLPFPMVTV